MILLTELSKPKVSNMRKKQIDRNVEPGKVDNASGQTLKTNTGSIERFVKIERETNQ